MFTTYNTRQGDTLDSLGARYYPGDPDGPARIARANPGLSDPLRPGITINIPQRTDRRPALPAEADETVLSVRGERFRFWTSVSVTRGVDEVATVSFEAPHEPDRPEFRRNFRPFGFAPVQLQVGPDRIFTGTMMGVDPQTTDQGRSVSVSAYAQPGVLQDVTAAPASYPLQFDGLRLPEIARALLDPFGIEAVFTTDPGGEFYRTELNPGAQIMPYLSQLAARRNLVLRDQPDGGLEFWQPPSDGDAVAFFQGDRPPHVEIAPTFDPQSYYSHITGLQQLILGAAGGEYTVKNPTLDGTLRPYTFIVDDSQDEDLEQATKARASRMFGDAASWTVTVPGWRTPGGALWSPGQFVDVLDRANMIYSKYRFLIRRVTLTAAGDDREADLEICLPETFSGQMPERLPWDF